MSGLDTLIRNGRRQLDAHRRMVAGLVALRASLLGDIERFKNRADAATDAIVERRERLERSVTEIDVRLAAVRSEVAETAAALERHQQASLRRARAERAARRRGGRHGGRN